MPTNDFLPFGTNGGAPILTQAGWVSAVPANGRGAGVVPKEYFNKAIRQGNNMASAIGAMLILNGQDALDDGNITALRDNIIAALKAFLVADADFTGTNQSLGGNGFQKLPGGLIIQWGSTSIGDISSGAGVTGAVSFPLAFPTGCYNVTASIQDVSASVAGAVFTAPPNTTGFNWRAQEWAAVAQASTLMWHAIGH